MDDFQHRNLHLFGDFPASHVWLRRIYSLCTVSVRAHWPRHLPTVVARMPGKVGKKFLLNPFESCLDVEDCVFVVFQLTSWCVVSWEKVEGFTFTINIPNPLVITYGNGNYWEIHRNPVYNGVGSLLMFRDRWVFPRKEFAMVYPIFPQRGWHGLHQDVFGPLWGINVWTQKKDGIPLPQLIRGIYRGFLFMTFLPSICLSTPQRMVELVDVTVDRMN